MIEKFQFRSFKSIEDVEFEPGLVSVLVGANGSGKSNLLEAIGVLSAAAQGRVDDAALLWRGVRPGVPALYKCSLSGCAQTPHIYFGAWNSQASYEVALHNPINDPLPAWRYKTESLKRGTEKISSRGVRDKKKRNLEAGLAALESVDLSADDPALQILNGLRDFAIYSPDTKTLRGLVTDSQPRSPIGLSGGQMPKAVADLLKLRRGGSWEKEVSAQARSLIDWAKSYGTAATASMPLSPSVGSAPRVIKFRDRFMKPPRDVLTGYDASEGALYVLFHAVLAAHPYTPSIYAVDNADHSLNPRLARDLIRYVCLWNLDSPHPRQIILTTQNPLALDGLPIQNDQVRLFVVSRTNKGRTIIRRIVLDEKLKKMSDQGWTLSRLWVMGHLGGVANV